MYIVRPAVLECNLCKSLIEVETDMDVVNYDEKSMGAEIEYIGELEFGCPECGKTIVVEISAWEYPQGILNYSKITSKGALVIVEPTLKCI